ncbi:MAG: urea ABC transporter permease subunit UrtB [Rhodospirillaceae bacterium]|jgi:urea transport system permease protein|nr:urea ABC transporter permease subunit UrtB [Rhodospirillaceae bacterium]MBT7954369.1 urea ABC transporter permease subunit UrtB [Rhodospirillaceae bacterium]
MKDSGVATFKKLLVLCAIAIGILGLGSANSFAGTLEETISALAKATTKQKIQAVKVISASGHERAADILKAFVGGKLYYQKSDKKVIITRKSGQTYLLFDPLTAKELGQAAKSTLKKIRVNNRIRQVIRGVLGGLTLMSKDPKQRLKAANAVFKSASASALSTLKKALERETEDKVKARMEMAIAATELKTSKDQAIRLAAIKSLTDHAVPEVRALLGSILAIEKDPKVKEAAAKALSDVEASLAFWNGIGTIFQGISLGSVLLLAAVGLAITFGVMGVINMAHGELVMLGAYTTFVVQEMFRTYFPESFGYSIAVAIPAAFIVAGGFGILIERGIIRYLYGRPLETLLATWGLSLILQQFVRSIFGPTNQAVGNPEWMSGAVEITGGLVLTYNRIWIIVFSLLVLGLLMLFLRKTSFGLQMRAVTQNRPMASSMGIKTGYIDALTFGLGSGVAGIAGVALSQIDNVSPNLGQAYIIDSFMVVVFGGVGNLWGTLVGAFSLGIANKFLEPFAGAVLAKIFVLVAIILFIQKRPRGLFALKGRAIDN